jgi:copper chaperone
MSTHVFSIDGLHCHGCAETVSTAIGGLPAVRSVDVNLDTKGTSLVTVEAEPSVSRADVQAVLDAEGNFVVLA